MSSICALSRQSRDARHGALLRWRAQESNWESPAAVTETARGHRDPAMSAVTNVVAADRYHTFQLPSQASCRALCPCANPSSPLRRHGVHASWGSWGQITTAAGSWSRAAVDGRHRWVLAAPAVPPLLWIRPLRAVLMRNSTSASCGRRPGGRAWGAGLECLASHAMQPPRVCVHCQKVGQPPLLSPPPSSDLSQGPTRLHHQ